MLVSVTVTEITSTVLGSTADESRPSEAAIVNLRTDISAITYDQDSEIDVNEDSFDSDIDETTTTSCADQDSENYCNDHSGIAAETVTVSTLSNSSGESRTDDERSNMPAITTRDFETDVDKSSSDSDVDETPANPAAKKIFENYDDEQINEVSQQQQQFKPK